MGDETMKRQHLNKMSTLLETLEIVSKNAKNKGHRSGFRCYELAKQIADQFDVFVPTLDSIITNKENKNNPTLIKGNKPMTKSQLVANLAESVGSDKASENRMIDALSAIISKEVAAGGAVTLPGIGKFLCRARPERMVRNPATGEQMKKPADRVVKVSIAKALKDVINP